jgi:hypothetical protein
MTPWYAGPCVAADRYSAAVDREAVGPVAINDLAGSD